MHQKQNIAGATPSNTLLNLPHGMKPVPGYVVDDTLVSKGQFAGAYMEYISGAAAHIQGEPLVTFHLPSKL